MTQVRYHSFTILKKITFGLCLKHSFLLYCVRSNRFHRKLEKGFVPQQNVYSRLFLVYEVHF